MSGHVRARRCGGSPDGKLASHGIRLPTSFALVGKTLSQADSIARTLDPELDPVALLEEDALEAILGEA